MSNDKHHGTTQGQAPCPQEISYDVHKLVRRGDVSGLTLALENGADIYSTDNRYSPDKRPYTPAMYAVIFDQMGALRVLLENGYDPNKKCHCNQDLLNFAFTRGALRNDLLKLLLNSGCDANSVHDREKTPLLIWAIINKKDDLFYTLIKDPKVDLNARAQNLGGCTPLIAAVNNRNSGAANALIEAGADVNIADNHGRTALIQATLNFNADTLNSLIKAGSNINAKDNKGNTALLYAIYQCEYEALDLLIGANADINIMDQERLTAINRTITNGQHVGQYVALFKLIDAGGDVNLKDITGNTAVLLLTDRYYYRNVDIEALQEVLKAGGDANARNQNGDTPIFVIIDHAGAERDPLRLKAMRLLIDNGANPNAIDRDGGNPLHRLANDYADDLDLFKLLLEAGADPYRKGKYGTTPLSLATSRDHRKIKTFLLDYFSKQAANDSEPHKPSKELLNIGVKAHSCDHK